MNDQEFYNFHTERLKELSEEVRDRAVEIVVRVLEISDVSRIKKEASKNKLNWSSRYHFSWGMWMRNQLRNRGIPDSALPSGNWDDYYVPVVELALGIRNV